MLSALEKYAPDILSATHKSFDQAERDGVSIRLNRTEFEKCPSDSIDYAIMEKIDNAAVIAPVDVGWNDIGSWTALPTDNEDDNVIAIDCDNTLIKTDGPKVAAIGVEDLIIIATGDSVLVMPRDRAQDVKKVVQQLEKEGRSDLL